MPNCNKYNCFANKDLNCTLLIETIDDCPFYKTNEQVAADHLKSIKRRSSLGFPLKRSEIIILSEAQGE